MQFTFDEDLASKAKMKVIGVGGAGGNAVNRMVQEGLANVEFICINTDAQALNANRAGIRLQIGDKITKGLGSGAHPEVGRQAMEEDRSRIAERLEGSDMVFITAGMGGGTGTGGAPVVAQLAHEMGILTVAIVTRPFVFEGPVRARNALRGIEELRKYVDSTIIIPNQKLLSITDKNTTLTEAFRRADDILYQGTKGIADLVSRHGLVNIDFADVKTIMQGMGEALMGTGHAIGEDRARAAALSAIQSPLLDDVNIRGAKGLLVNITGGEDLTLWDVEAATNAIYEVVGGEASGCNVILGAVIDPELNEQIQVTVVATGFSAAAGHLNPAEENRMATQPEKRERVTVQITTELTAPKKSAPLAEPSSLKDLFPLPEPPAEETPAPEEDFSTAGLNAEESEDLYQPGPESARGKEPGEKQMEIDFAEPRPLVEPPAAEESLGRKPRLDDLHKVKVPYKKYVAQKYNPFEKRYSVEKARIVPHTEDNLEVPTFIRQAMD